MKKPIKDRLIRYDAVLKDLFQQDHPALPSRLTGRRGGATVAQCRIRRNDRTTCGPVTVTQGLLVLKDKSIFHLDFQSESDPDVPYREESMV
jgi:hypothetical protein